MLHPLGRHRVPSSSTAGMHMHQSSATAKPVNLGETISSKPGH